MRFKKEIVMLAREEVGRTNARFDGVYAQLNEQRHRVENLEHLAGANADMRYRGIQERIDHQGEQIRALRAAAVGVVFRGPGKMVAEGQYDNPTITNDSNTGNRAKIFVFWGDCDGGSVEVCDTWPEAEMRTAEIMRRVEAKANGTVLLNIVQGDSLHVASVQRTATHINTVNLGR